jgi:hypothetical protein
MPVEKITPAQVQERMHADPAALLVCAYDDPVKFEQNHLEGCISFQELQSMAPALPRDREIIFFCA